MGCHDPQKGYKDDLSDCDGIHVATPSWTHYQVARKWIEAGMHVLIEKPMTTNSDDALKLADLARRKKRILMVGHIFRYSDFIISLKGQFKDIKEIKLRWRHESQQPHVLWDLAPHMFDLLNFLTDEWDIEPKCVMSNNCKRAYIIGKLGDVLYDIDLSLEQKNPLGGKQSKVRELQIDHHLFFPLERQTNNTVKDEISEFIKCIENKERPSTDPFLGYMTVREIEMCLEGHTSKSKNRNWNPNP